MLFPTTLASWMSAAALSELVAESFHLDAAAPKPGNVSLHNDGYGMSGQDFVRSAEVSTPLLCDSTRSCGARILAAMQATRQAVGCNTNLGMLLLFAPLVCAAQRSASQEVDALRQCLKALLSSLDGQDTQDIFAAIRLADPGGLGEVPAHDVRQAPDCGILQAMQAAGEQDRIAWQYCSGFADVFTLGLEALRYFTRRGDGMEWATVGVYLMFLSRFEDSHIRRKHGSARAAEVRKGCAPLAERFRSVAEPEVLRDELACFGARLRSAGLNPGTSADLAAASVLLYLLSESAHPRPS